MEKEGKIYWLKKEEGAPHEILNTIESLDVYSCKKVATIKFKTDNKQQTS